MGKKKPATLVFDPSLFGRILREQRRLAGYSNTKVFSQAIQEKTGVFVDFDTLMKYERGEREPDVSKLLGIAFTLYGQDWPEEVVWMCKTVQKVLDVTDGNIYDRDSDGSTGHPQPH